MNLKSLTPLKEKLENHSIFSSINTIEQLKVFMEHHIFAVWDFMSLLKKLQMDFVPMGSPWIPNPNGNMVRFINEIVMEEESDLAFAQGGDENYKSHFELYLEAMKEVGASTETIRYFLESVQKQGITSSLQMVSIPSPSQSFMKNTFELIQNGKLHQIASSFAIGREDIVPLMFQRILDHSKLGKDEVPVFRYYLERHAELDGDHHGPMAQKLLVGMCAGNPLIEEEILCQAELSIKQRITFWDGVLHALPSSS